MYSRLSNARHLEKLVFGRSCYWRSKSIQKLNQVLLNIANLQVLHIKYICQPEMLEGLPESCPQIRELSLEVSLGTDDEESASSVDQSSFRPSQNLIWTAQF